jgi:fucose 4-O-acetylase-like acetyltransferase
MSPKASEIRSAAADVDAGLWRGKQPLVGPGRVFYWDNFKGVLIALVVIGHFLYEYRAWPGILPVVTGIYAFHMPAFLFISGYFSRSERSSSPEALSKLLIWFAIMNYSMMAVGYAVGTVSSFSLSHLVYSSWYLLALFLYRLILPAVRNVPLIVPLSIAISIAVGFVDRFTNFFLWAKIVALFPFFICGATVSKRWIEDFIAWWKQRPVLLLVAGLVVAAPTILLILQHRLTLEDVLWARPYANWRGTAHRVVAFIAAISITGILLGFIPRIEIRWLTKWGRNSLAIYVSHRVLTVLLHVWWPQLLADVYGYLMLALISIVALIVLGSDTYARPFTRMLDGITSWLLPPGVLTRVGARVARGGSIDRRFFVRRANVP